MKNDYCVYVHRRKDNNTIFYVGHGSKNRPACKSGRNTDWKDVVNSVGYTIEILKSGLTKLQAISLEIETYEIIKDKTVLLNRVKPCDNKHYDFEYFNNYVYYDETSPTCLRWKVDIGFGGYSSRSRKVGDIAGNNTVTNSARKLSLHKKSHLLHRVVWLLCNGSIDPSLVIDHIDGNNQNNKISNLRQVTSLENARNRKLSKYNKSGVTGIMLVKRKDRKAQQWKAIFTGNDGKTIQKYFSIIDLGEEEAFRLACEWRAERIAELNEHGAGYTERHGT